MSRQPNSYRHKYNKVLLRFYEPLENNYLNTRIGQEISGIKLIFGSLAIINPLFILLDFSRLENPIDSISIRIVLEIIFITVIIIHYRLRDNALGHQILFFSSSIVIYFYLLVSTSVSSDYYELFIPNCTILMLLINASFIGLRFRHSIFLNLFIIILYAGYSYWISSVVIHWKQLPFLGIFFVISSVLSYLFERKSRALFLKNEFIEDQNRIIEQKNEELSGQNELKNSLISILSHDIKSPLSSLEMLLKLSSEEVISTQDTISHFNKVGKSVGNISKFVSNMILWIKSQMDGIKIKKEPLQVKTLIDQIIELSEEQSAEKGVKIKNQFDVDCIMTLDREMISIVVRNLISNAIKFSHQNGIITIRECKKEKQFGIQVIDDGVGMDSNTLNSIFRMEIDGSSLGTNKEEGTGLGLILSYNLVQKMGGELISESELGKGAIFTILFNEE